MFYAMIETDGGEIFRLARPDGHTGGKPLISLLTPLALYSDRGGEDDDRSTSQWRRDIPDSDWQVLCRSVDTLMQSVISMERDYSEIDFEYFNSRISPGTFTKQQYQAIIERAEIAWTPIEELINAIEELETVLSKYPAGKTYWYEVGETDHDLTGLKQTLMLGKTRGADKARINMT